MRFEKINIYESTFKIRKLKFKVNFWREGSFRSSLMKCYSEMATDENLEQEDEQSLSADGQPNSTLWAGDPSSKFQKKTVKTCMVDNPDSFLYFWI